MRWDYECVEVPLSQRSCSDISGGSSFFLFSQGPSQRSQIISTMKHTTPQAAQANWAAVLIYYAAKLVAALENKDLYC
jgi:hypothetical protein